MRSQRLAIHALALVVLFHCHTVMAADVNDFIDFSAAALPGRLYIPPEAEESATPRPVILFLHGAGETGNDNALQVNGNIDNLLTAAKQRGAFLYAPQATSFNWSDSSRTTNVMTMIDQLLVEQNADLNRMYVTGLSMGGGGTWNVFSRFTDRFAAAVPIAAVTPAADFDPANLVEKPTWAFHARNDAVVSKNASRNVVHRVLTAAGEPSLTFPADNDTSTFAYVNETVQLNYTEWPTGGHGIWGRVYGTSELYDWMFAQSLLGTSIGNISLSGLDGIYRQDFDDALGSDGATVGATLPNAWTNGAWGTATTAAFPVEGSFLDGLTFNAGAANDTDRALAIGVNRTSDDRYLQLHASVTDADASSFRLRFDIEAWDARDGIFVPVLNRFLNLPSDPGEAAFQVAVDIDTGDGFAPLMDLGIVTTGPTLQPVSGGMLDGNAEANRVSFDSGVLNAAIPAGSDLRFRWTAATEAASDGWVFGIDNVVLSLMSGSVDGDINGDGAVDVADLDALTAAITAGTGETRFDLDGSGNVDAGDRVYWVSDIKGTFFGDANLDHVVDATDLNTLGLNWQSTAATSWSQGDFNGDGNVNASDLNDIGTNWRNNGGALAAVPEPSALGLLVVGLVLFGLRRGRFVIDQ